MFGSVCIIFTILFVVCKPYKAQYSVYNTITVVLFLALLALTMLLVGYYVIEIMFDQEIIVVTLFFGFLTIPLFYIVGLALLWIWKHNLLKKHCYRYIKRKQAERSMTTATLFKAAESKSRCTQRYGAIVN